MTPVRPPVLVVGARLEPEHHRLRDFLTRAAQPFRWIDHDSPEAAALLARHGAGADDLPLLIEGGSALTGVTAEGLAHAWNLSPAPRQRSYDVAIVGAGPAGLAAAVYAASDGLSTLVLERDLPGGQASHTSRIENFFGFPGGIGGAELARLAGRQAEGFGAELLIMRGVTGSSRGPDGPFTLEVDGGHSVDARIVIAAPGMVWRRLALDGLDDLLGRGVYYGAGRSEAAECGGDPVAVVGAGNSAGQAVMDLANAGAEVTMVVRGEALGRTMSAYLVERVAAHPLIDVRLRTEVQAVHADDEGRLAGVTLREHGAATSRIPARALFVCIGGAPRTGWATDAGVHLDPAGYVLTGPDLVHDGGRPADWPLARDPLMLETSVPGLFAAGDVRHGSVKRVAAAVGEGSMAVALAHRRLAELLETA